MVGNGLKWLEMTGNGWKWLEMIKEKLTAKGTRHEAQSRRLWAGGLEFIWEWEWLEMVKNDWKWLEMVGKLKL